MAALVSSVKDSFTLLHEALRDGDFRKSTRISSLSERELLTPVKFFLLGWFGAVQPEYWSKLPKAASKWGRIDYVIDGTAIELAVNPSTGNGSPLSAGTNETEVQKLLKFDGPSILVLLDLARSRRLSDTDLEAYRELPSLGPGNHKTSSFNVLYYHFSGGVSTCEHKRIRA